MRGHIEAVALYDGAIRLTLSPDVADTVLTSVREFIAALETGRRPGVLRRRLSNWRLFPHAYPRPKASRQFRQRHNGWMRESLLASACSIRDGWSDEPTFVLDRAAIADWFAVCGLAQTLYVQRRSRNPLQGSFGHGRPYWLAQVQQYVATAACGHDWQRLLGSSDAGRRNSRHDKSELAAPDVGTRGAGRRNSRHRTSELAVPRGASPRWPSAPYMYPRAPWARRRGQHRVRLARLRCNSRRKR